ncbi:MAG: M23 family metallopeptidase, partial [Vicinamibacterales bacterium]|nr:M23 family metallopeptidase [Vicinamibacterales bacterium]
MRSLLAVLLVALVGCGGGGGGTTGNPLAPSSNNGAAGDTGGASGTTPTFASVPTGLAMPFRVDDINLRGVINPFGIVRSSLDQGAIGHPGMDIPMDTGAPLFAVGAGTIVSVGPSIDSRPGSLVKLLVGADSTAGSGWVFLYEHVTLLAGLGVDSEVTRGQQIATNPMDPSFGNHLELATPSTISSFTRTRPVGSTS